MTRCEARKIACDPNSDMNRGTAGYQDLVELIQILAAPVCPDCADVWPHEKCQGCLGGIEPSERR